MYRTIFTIDGLDPYAYAAMDELLTKFETFDLLSVDRFTNLNTTVFKLDIKCAATGQTIPHSEFLRISAQYNVSITVKLISHVYNNLGVNFYDHGKLSPQSWRRELNKIQETPDSIPNPKYIQDTLYELIDFFWGNH